LQKSRNESHLKDSFTQTMQEQEQQQQQEQQKQQKQQKQQQLSFQQ